MSLMAIVVVRIGSETSKVSPTFVGNRVWVEISPTSGPVMGLVSTLLEPNSIELEVRSSLALGSTSSNPSILFKSEPGS